MQSLNGTVIESVLKELVFRNHRNLSLIAVVRISYTIQKMVGMHLIYDIAKWECPRLYDCTGSDSLRYTCRTKKSSNTCFGVSEKPVYSSPGCTTLYPSFTVCHCITLRACVEWIRGASGDDYANCIHRRKVSQMKIWRRLGAKGFPQYHTIRVYNLKATNQVYIFHDDSSNRLKHNQIFQTRAIHRLLSQSGIHFQ